MFQLFQQQKRTNVTMGPQPPYLLDAKAVGLGVSTPRCRALGAEVIPLDDLLCKVWGNGMEYSDLVGSAALLQVRREAHICVSCKAVVEAVVGLVGAFERLMRLRHPPLTGTPCSPRLAG